MENLDNMDNLINQKIDQKFKENNKKNKIMKIILIITIFINICLLIYNISSLINIKYYKQCYERYNDRYCPGRDRVKPTPMPEIKPYPFPDDSYDDMVEMKKPVIYLYPEKEEVIKVDLMNKEDLTTTYPKYEKNGDWEVLAKPDGKLKDLKTGRELYSLYYESKTFEDIKIEDEGFVVKKNEIIPFLEEKLEILGLNEIEAQEMIIYWLPRLEENKYNYIRFLSKEEIESKMPIEFSKEPETLIRIMMSFKGLDEKIDVKEQKLEKAERKGYTAIEWGGVEIK